MTDPIIVTRDASSGVATITFNRPERLNAIDLELARAFRDATLSLESDDNVRVVILRGAGAGFMAGGDVQLFRERLGRDLDRVILDITHDLHDAIIAIRRMPKPVIAAVHGPCAGAGFSSAMACDMVIAAESASFTLAYSRIGASPDGSSTYFLPRLVGLHKAMELVFLNEVHDALAMSQLGLVNFVVANTDLDDETANLAKRLASGPTLAYARAKRLLNQSMQVPLEAQLDAEAQSISASSNTLDFAEGVTAFAEKRPPNFIGK